MIQFRIIIEETQVMRLQIKFDSQALAKFILGNIIAVNNVPLAVLLGVLDCSI